MPKDREPRGQDVVHAETKVLLGTVHIDVWGAYSADGDMWAMQGWRNEALIVTRMVAGDGLEEATKIVREISMMGNGS